MARKDAIKTLRQVLKKRRDALTKALAGDFSMLKELRQQATGDVIDFALDTAQDEINSQLAEVESRELARIQYALEKMDEGSYGKCEACNCNIPLARLQALPYATLCVDCKRKAEASGINPASQADWSQIVDSATTDDMRTGDMDVNIS